MWKVLIQIVLLAVPWPIRRRALGWLFGYEIHPTARIGMSVILARRLRLDEGAWIGHFNVIRPIEQVELAAAAVIGHFNRIGGRPLLPAEAELRLPSLALEPHAAITSRHLIDCTDRVEIGAYAILAGYRSQILTHSVDIGRATQESGPVRIGERSFVGTASVVLMGAVLPPYSILGAASLLNKRYAEPYMLYAGVPARPIRPIPRDSAYFLREEGTIY